MDHNFVKKFIGRHSSNVSKTLQTFRDKHSTVLQSSIKFIDMRNVKVKYFLAIYYKSQKFSAIFILERKCPHLHEGGFFETILKRKPIIFFPSNLFFFSIK